MNSTLHILNQNPLETQAKESIKDWLKEGDGLLCIENAVYCYAKLFSNPALFSPNPNIHFYFLEADMATRGIEPFSEHSGIQVVDYSEMVDLVLTYPNNKTW